MSQVKVLIAEDDLLVVEDLKQKLEQVGYLIEAVAQSPDLILPMTRRCRPDLIIMDVNLHGDSNGLKTAIQLQESLRLPMIFLTAYSADVQEHASELHLSYRVIVKPFAITKLKEAIASLLL